MSGERRRDVAPRQRWMLTVAVRRPAPRGLVLELREESHDTASSSWVNSIVPYRHQRVIREITYFQGSRGQLITYTVIESND